MTYQTDAFNHGIGNSTVSKQWFSRSNDEKFLSLEEMYNAKKVDANSMDQTIVNTHKIEIEGTMTEASPTRGELSINYFDENRREGKNSPTNWSFGQLSQLAGAPSGYLNDLPAPLVADCLNWGLRFNRGKELIKTYGGLAHGSELRAATGPDYGRIFDHEIIKVAMDQVERSGGRWKIPGMMVGSRDGYALYDPDVPVSLDTTTLFASDRDVFIFLVDDKNPIEVGKLANGDPDLMFRGFYMWNSETGSKTAGIAGMYLRGVCMNRNLWGVENFHEIKIRHTKFAPERFADEATPALESFATNSTMAFVEGIEAAKAAKIESEDNARLEFLVKRGNLSQRMAKAAMKRHELEEGRPIENLFDAAQGITAIARDIPHQDNRVSIERKAGAILDLALN
jgi:hypothetical protein